MCPAKDLDYLSGFVSELWGDSLLYVLVGQRLVGRIPQSSREFIERRAYK